MIERLSLAGARYIKNNGGRPDVSVGMMRYALQLWINLLFTVGLAIGFGLLLGSVRDSLISLLAIGFLRYFSGGWHFKSLDLCVVFSAAVAAIIPLVPQVAIIWLEVMNCISLLLVLLLAPTGHEQNFKSELQKTVFKWIAASLILINFIYPFQIITISYLCQSLSLITLERRKGQ